MFDQYNDWITDRLGKFTASEIWKLMEKGRGKDEYFGKGAKTYIRQKAAEILTQEPINGGRLNIAALEWGSAHEHEAVKRFEKETGLTVEYYGGASPKFFDYTPFSGGSPDGLITGEAIIEIKCPFNSAEHIEHLLINTSEDLKDYYPEAYWQILFNMICTETSKGYFISYDNRFAEEPLQTKIVEVFFNENDRDLLLERLKEAESQLALIIGLVRDLLPADN